MLSSSLRSTSRVTRAVALRHARVGASALSTTSEEQLQEWKQRGLMGDDGLTRFKTLHEMQVHSCEVYADNDLFGTYQEASGAFEYMTYAEYEEKVNTCRAVLKDLGELFVHTLLRKFLFFMSNP